MRTLTSGTLTVQAYDANVWLQERNVLRIKDTGATKVSLGLNPSQGFATYTLDANHEALVDMSDYIRTHATATDIYVRSNSGADVYVNANYTPVGLINPANVLIPQDETLELMVDYFNDEESGGGDNLRIIPPRRMLQSINQASLPLIFEIGTVDEALVRDVHFAIMAYVGSTPYWCDTDGSVSMPPRTSRLKMHADAGDVTFIDIDLAPLECAKYAAVRWVSFTGKTRLHTLEVRDLSQTADEVIKLETLDGSYNQIKGRTDGFKLYLDDLTAYDYWYYADIITSSKVEVSLDGITWNQVEVTTKSVTIPNTSEGKTNKLEITVNWRNYDAVTM